ncbi:hypothetical protein [Pseudemcibacter aquimaris]|uniref:hypothetical protein n=1 Tax=Pseudemcibacter aquimaris TaxID=2857064 RepID=UPI00201258DE|nr:hypothetical protein [Pseudemcibacter aquimaris]MCC3859918.1 hypothetical protein [Pseudemcibacter aquimaris]WDU57250.1 hypothetical protein KW060_08570 [Pseudemcibacter aquimaris]
MGLFVGVPFALFGLYHFLKMEFKTYSALNLFTVISVISAVLLVNEVRVRHFLGTSSADQMVKQADDLWQVSKVRQSYETLENAIEVANFQRDEKALIDGYMRITDRYFVQENYKRPVRFSALEREYLKRTHEHLSRYKKGVFSDEAVYYRDIDFDVFDEERDETERLFYQNLHALNRDRNNRFRDNLFYSTVPITGSIKEDMDATREAYMRAVNVITLAMQVEDNIIPSSLLGKYYHAMSTLEENMGNDRRAFDYIQKSKYYWNDFRPKIQAVRLAFKVGYDDDAHAMVNEIVTAHLDSGIAENEIFVLEAAALEYAHDHLHHARGVYESLQSHLAGDLRGFDNELHQVNQDLGRAQQSRAYLYPFLNDVKSIRNRMVNVDKELDHINYRFAELSTAKEIESKTVEMRGRMDLAIDYMFEAVGHAEDAGHKVLQFKHHLRLAKLYNKLGLFSEARDHALLARGIHNGDNFLLVRDEPENDLARHYPVLLEAQLGLGDLEGAEETLMILQDLGRSRVYELRQPNTEMIEYLKGKVYYHVKTGEMMRAQLYHDDAVKYLLDFTAANGIPLKADIYPDLMFASNKYERHLIELILLGDQLFKNGDVPGFLITKTQRH